MVKKIYIHESEGVKLCGILSTPIQNETNSLVILCHGFGNNKDSSTNKALEEKLNMIGMATFRFDFFGHGESSGNFQSITISKASKNIESVIRFFKQEGYSKIGLVGSSFGGTAALMASSQEIDLDLLVLKCPVSSYKERDDGKKEKEDLNEWAQKGVIFYTKGSGGKVKLNYSFYTDYLKQNGYEAAKKITVPTLIVHGDQDESVSVVQSRRTSKLIPNATLEIIKGADHKFSKNEDFQKMTKRIVAFVNKNLILNGNK